MMKRVFALMLAFSAACGDGSDGSSAAVREGGADNVGHTGAGSVDACEILLSTDIDAALSPRVFAAGVRGTGDLEATETTAAVSTCTFTSEGASVQEIISVNLLARSAPSDATGTTVAQAKEGAVMLMTTPMDVAGLGDAAYWINIGGTRTNIQLNVFKGARLWLIFSVSASTLDEAAALQALEKLAQASLSRL